MFGTLRGMCSSAIIVDYYNEEENRKDEYTYDHGECCLWGLYYLITVMPFRR